MKIFIGSASESIHLAKSVEYILKKCGHTPKRWDDKTTFIPSTYTLNNLEKLAKEYDVAMFICSEDDETISRGDKFKVTRDNVIFEAGIFAGAMGHEKVALCIHGNPKIPSDWLGLTGILWTDDMGENEIQIEKWLKNVSEINENATIARIREIDMMPRYEADEKLTLEERWKYAKEITIINFASTAFIAAQEVVPQHVSKSAWRRLYQKKIEEGCTFKFLITEPDSYADFDASFSKMNVIPNKNIEISDIISKGLTGLEKDAKLLNENIRDGQGNLEYATTRIALPYALIMVTNDEEHSDLDHIKVDLYSPYLASDGDRRSFFLYPNNKNYRFFYDQITALWKLEKEKKKRGITVPQKIDGSDISSNLELVDINRLYFVGDLHKGQQLKHVYDSKVEMGTSWYKEFTVDQPHFHKYATEYLYILEGEYKLCIKTERGLIYENLQQGDFYVIPKLTAYASKANKGTKVLFVKAPGLDDKIECNREDFENFTNSWDS